MKVFSRKLFFIIFNWLARKIDHDFSKAFQKIKTWRNLTRVSVWFSINIEEKYNIFKEHVKTWFFYLHMCFTFSFVLEHIETSETTWERKFSNSLTS